MDVLETSGLFRKKSAKKQKIASMGHLRQTQREHSHHDNGERETE
jgi:hypothetical protein